MRFLRYATALYAVGLALHTADHLRRGVAILTPEVLWLGNISTAAGLATIALVFLGHRWAAPAAAGLGLPVAAGVAAVHLLPHWGVFSDAFVGSTQAPAVTAFSWFVVLLEVTGAVAMGLAGVTVMRRPQERAPHLAHQ